MTSALAATGGAMEKYMCYGALGVAAVMGLLFLLDLTTGMAFGGKAFGGPFLLTDVFGLLAAVAVGYLGFNASRDLK